MRADAHDTGVDRRLHAAIPRNVASIGVLGRMAHRLFIVCYYGVRREYPKAQMGQVWSPADNSVADTHAGPPTYSFLTTLLPLTTLSLSTLPFPAPIFDCGTREQDTDNVY